MPLKLSVNSLEKLSFKIKRCTLCKLSRTRTNAVDGKGPQRAKVMFVGEAPGRNEDIEGKPFVGYSGGILDTALSKAGIRRSDIFITNIVKCRPPNNRRPDKDELSACRDYLEKQIAFVCPKMICILGGTAYHALLGGKSIVADRGKIVEKEGKRYFLTIHPASVIYNGSLRSALEEDLKTLAKEMYKRRRTRSPKQLSFGTITSPYL